MAIDQGWAQQHVDRWTALLAASRAPYRKLWPNYLFRHEEIRNSAQVIRVGQLLSRNQASGFIDVAAGDILAQNPRAHSFSRLYFRPQSPTQYRIEGVRKPHEVWHGAHAPVLVMFAFSAVSVLSLDGTNFSNGNMQSPDSRFGDDEAFFNEISFPDVYHVGSFTPEHKDRIVRARCAEVLAVSPLPLVPHLKAIVCRSPAERAFLMDQIGSEAAQFYGRIIVSHSEPGIFESKWAYVDTVDARRDGFRLKFHPRIDGATCAIKVRVLRNGVVVWSGENAAADLSTVWTVPYELSSGWYRCEIDIDECLAYSAMHLVDELPF